MSDLEVKNSVPRLVNREATKCIIKLPYKRDNDSDEKSSVSCASEIIADKTEDISDEKTYTIPAKVSVKPTQILGTSSAVSKSSAASGRNTPSKYTILHKTAGKRKYFDANVMKSTFTKPKTAARGSIQTGKTQISANTNSLSGIKVERLTSSRKSPLVTGVSNVKTRETETIKLRVFEGMQKKMQSMQSDFIKKFENLKITSADKVKYEFKLITMVKSNECRLLIKNDDMMWLTKKLPLNSVAHVKDKIKTMMNQCFTAFLYEVKRINSNGTGKVDVLKVAEIQNEVDHQKKRLLYKMNASLNMLVTDQQSENDAEAAEMQSELNDGEDLQKKLDDIEENLDNDGVKEDMELQQKVKIPESQHQKLCTTSTESHETSPVDCVGQTKLANNPKTGKGNNYTLVKTSRRAEEHLNLDRREKKENSEVGIEEKEQLQPRNKSKENWSVQIKAKDKEITRLKHVISTLKNERDSLHIKLNSSKEECSKFCEIRQKLQIAEGQISLLQAELNEPRDYKEHDPASWPDAIQNEIARYQQLEHDMKQKAKLLQNKLSKSYSIMCNLEAQLQRIQEALKVRSGVMSSLQAKNKQQHSNLDEELVEEKNDAINGLSNVVQVKSENCANLSAEMTATLKEIARQDQIILLLKENNERYHISRIKNEEEIGRMADEIAKLKNSISECYKNSA